MKKFVVQLPSTNEIRYALQKVYFSFVHNITTAVAQWLRLCATHQKVGVSIPDGVMEFFIDITPSDRNMVLGSTQPLTEMSTGNIS
jgi:hypothetical protein